MGKTADKNIDILKFFFAICIVCLHCDIFPEASVAGWFISKFVFRTAVPFFFLCSGYYFSLSTALMGDKAALKKYVSRLAIPFLFYSLIYNSYYFFRMVYSGYAIKDTIIYILQHFAFYPLGALWFVSACIVSALFFTLLKHYCRHTGILLIVGAILYCFALMTNTYYFFGEIIGIASFLDRYLLFFLSGRNGLFLGGVYFCIGFLLSRNKNIIESRFLGGALLISAVLLIFEIVLTKEMRFGDEQSLYISQLVFVPCLFCFAKRMTVKFCFETYKLRRLSSFIYFTHRIIRDPLYDGWTFLFHKQMNHLLLLLCVLLLSSAIGLIMINSKNRFLRKLL